MIGMLATMLAMWLVIVFAPATPIGQLIRSLLVERPAARLSRMTRGHLALVVIAAVAIGAVAWMGEGDGLRMLAMAAPETVTWLTTFEVAAWLDVAVAALAAWSATRLRLPVLLSTLRGGRPRRRRTPRSATPAANDDEPGDRRRCA